MPKYLFQTKYTASGAQGLAKDGGTTRAAVVEKVVKRLEGKLEAFYFAFGEVDAIVIADLPDHAAAGAIALAVNQSGAATVKTTVLITPAEFDKATKKTVDYTPPGR